MTPRDIEEVLNIQLSDELRARGLSTQPEALHPGNLRVDVEVRIGPARIAVEAEHGQSAAKRRQAIIEADGRLPGDQNLADLAVAVCYPADTTRESLPGTDVIWAIRDGNGGPATWTGGNLDELASVIRLAPAQLGNPDFAAAALSVSLDVAGRDLSKQQKQALAQALDLPRQTRNRKPVRNPWDAPAKRALLVVATAVMFHSRLDPYLSDMRPEYDNRIPSDAEPQLFTGEWPPISAVMCTHGRDPVQDFIQAWDLILALDYKPIFVTGRAALLACQLDPAFANAVRQTAIAALAVVQDIAGMRHDLMGRVFHRVLDTARYDGSFYTTTAAATLLATLAINDDLCNWADPEAIARIRITDPACGTGTLLMAAAERIRELAPQIETDGSLARALIEQVLSGYDVNLTATHMAATTLGLLSPTTQFNNMKIGRTLLGLDKTGNARLGSLDFLGDNQPMLIPFPGAEPLALQVETGEETAQAEPADLVIMNPPFTRDSLRHDQFDDDTERKMKAQEKDLFANTPTYMSGNSGAFIVLADYISKADTGVIAAILPLAGATALSGFGIRELLGSRYHVETLVTSHDPERIYFSENTSIGEMLMVCRRWPSGDAPKPPTRVVNLAWNPATPAEAIQVALAIRNGIVANRGYGTVQEWPANAIASGDWGAVQFLSPYLCLQFAALKGNGFFSSVTLGEISEIGPEGRRIRDAYTRSNMPGAHGRVALWLHDTDVIQSLVATPDVQIHEKDKKEHLAERYWQQRSRLLLPTRARLNTVKALGVRLNTPAVGSAWTPCRINVAEVDKEDLEKSVCVYLNSSIGVLALLGDRSNKEISYPRFSLDDLRKLPVPNLAAIGNGAAERLAGAYDALAAQALLPLPQMDACPVRRALDDAVCDALELDAERVATIRRNLAAEPSVTGQRYAGLRPA